LNPDIVFDCFPLNIFVSLSVIQKPSLPLNVSVEEVEVEVEVEVDVVGVVVCDCDTESNLFLISFTIVPLIIFPEASFPDASPTVNPSNELYA
jgi:hypothetical protein